MLVIGVDHWRVFSFCNLDVTEVAEFVIGVSARTLGAVAGADEGSNSNIMNNDRSKEPSKSIYINNHCVTSVNDSEMIT